MNVHEYSSFNKHCTCFAGGCDYSNNEAKAPISPKRLTNADKIRSMTNEELAEFLQKLKLIAIAGDRIGLGVKQLAGIEWLNAQASEKTDIQI